jgi:hypothetical protein
MYSFNKWKLGAGKDKRFLFFTTSRLVLGPNQPPIKWVQEAVSSKVKWLEFEADHSPPFSPEVKGGRAIPPLPHSSA